MAPPKRKNNIKFMVLKHEIRGVITGSLCTSDPDGFVIITFSRLIECLVERHIYRLFT
jgi:hypothetical protein